MERWNVKLQYDRVRPKQSRMIYSTSTAIEKGFKQKQQLKKKNVIHETIGAQ